GPWSVVAWWLLPGWVRLGWVSIWVCLPVTSREALGAVHRAGKGVNRRTLSAGLSASGADVRVGDGELAGHVVAHQFCSEPERAPDRDRVAIEVVLIAYCQFDRSDDRGNLG